MNRYDFESFTDRHGRDSIAVDIPEEFGPQGKTLDGFERLPMWVADMNFPACPSILERLHSRVDHPMFGYFVPSDEYYEAIIKWHKTRKGFRELERKNISYDNGVLAGIVSTLNVLCSRGDTVLLNSPTYIGFTNTLTNNGYRIELSPLKMDESRIWRFDLEDMEERIVRNHIHAAILCSPHNPCGRVWGREELEAVMAVFERHDVWVVCDEIWSDIILDGRSHTSLQCVNEYARTHSVVMYAPGKTFNLAGLVGSYHICYNEWLNDRIRKESSLCHANEMNVLWMHALIGAYSREGMEWTDSLCRVLSKNVRYAVDFIRRELPGIELAEPEGTYMLFLDCEKWCISKGETIDELQERGVRYGVIWQDGRPFHGSYGIRMNLALPSEKVREAFSRLKKYVFAQNRSPVRAHLM